MVGSSRSKKSSNHMGLLRFVGALPNLSGPSGFNTVIIALMLPSSRVTVGCAKAMQSPTPL
jgi:hypothetical protein